jgi:hypothetical protein
MHCFDLEGFSSHVSTHVNYETTSLPIDAVIGDGSRLQSNILRPQYSKCAFD